ncbi:MAG TPA: permease-like cell division protein FtsX [Baekduia sp.]|nr:permease-like cell division protein FtsX [Baekduia sp.]
MKFPFFFREALQSIKRNPIPSFAAMASVLVTVLVLGVFIPMVQATTDAANDVRGRVHVNVFMKSDATRAQASLVRQKIDKVDGIKKVEFVTKEAAYQAEKKRFPELYELTGKNPLGDTFRITPSDPDDASKIASALAPTGANGVTTPVDGAIESVKSRRDDANKLLTATRVAKLAMAVLMSLLLIASVLLISNTIRLSLFSRRREVEVMKLVGATDSFIRVPFVIEGILLGALGGVMAVLLLAVGKIALVDPLASDFALISAPRTMNFGLLVGLLLAASILVSAAGSGLSLRRFLRV